MSRKDDDKAALKPLQQRLSLIQQAMGRAGRSAVIVFEGPDAAGKGGIIRRLGWCLDPRWLQVWPISAPDSNEQRQHWLQRFWTRMPPAGVWAVFDRSWYGRVLVERVEGFASPAQWERAYEEINQFESVLMQEHLQLIKVWLDISPETQLRRFAERLEDPAKRWKLTDEDLRNRERWGDYDVARRDMIERTSTATARWHCIEADDKHAARRRCFELLVEELGRDLDLTPPAPSTAIASYIRKATGKRRHEK